MWKRITFVVVSFLVGVIFFTNCGINKKTPTVDEQGTRRARVSQTANSDEKFTKDASHFHLSKVDSLSGDLQARYDRRHLPGFGVAVFTKDRILYQEGFGYSALATEKPFTSTTIQMIASVSKTFIGVALMKAVEDAKISLDDDINGYLPFMVSNPYYPEAKITVRQLAMHTSSINDEQNYNRTYVFAKKLLKEEFDEAWHELIEVYSQNEIMAMGDFLKNIFSEDGKWYDSGNFYEAMPGESYEYSNLGAALLAFVIERATGENFKAYTHKHIFDPLKMTSTSWERPLADNENHTIYYRPDFTPFPNYNIITYPDGGLYSTVADLTKYLQEMIKGYHGEGTILKKDAFVTMLSKQSNEEDFPDGLCWDLSIPCCIGHAGNDFGTSTLMYFEPATGIGRILFANVSLEKEEQEEEFYGIFNDLFKYDLRK